MNAEQEKALTKVYSERAKDGELFVGFATCPCCSELLAVYSTPDKVVSVPVTTQSD